jgi:hypothetical protein
MPLCSFGLCFELHHQHKILQQPNLIALEPTVGFMTLDATDLFLFHGKIFVFRRISDKCSEYGLNLENIMPKERLAYCVECLQYLWDRRIHAWSTKEKFGNSFEGFKHGFKAINVSHSYDSHPSRHSSQHHVTRHTTPLDFGENRVDHETAQDIEYSPEVDEEYDDEEEDDEEEDDEEEDEENSIDILDASSRGKRSLSHILSLDDTGDVSIEKYPRLGDSTTDNTNTSVELSFQLEGANNEASTTPQKMRVLSEKAKPPLEMCALESSNSLSPQAARALARGHSTAKRVNNAALSFSVYTPPHWVAINTPPRQLFTSTSALRQLSSNIPTTQPTVRPRMYHEELEYLDDQMNLTTEQPLQARLNIPVFEKYRGARAGVPLGDPVEYQHKKGISFPAPPMQDLGLMFPKESLEETYIERPQVYGGGVTRQAIISSSVRASGVKASNQELEVLSPARNGFKHIPQSVLDLGASLIASSTLPSTAAQDNGLQTFPATAKTEMALLPANAVNTSPNVHIKTPALSTPLGRTETPMVLPLAEVLAHMPFVKPLVSKPQMSTTVANTQCRQPKSLKIQSASEAHLLAQQRSNQAAQSQQARGRVPIAPILCSCRKPSHPGDKIVACTNTACSILRYHYRCLDKSQKLSTKGAKWVCMMCKATAMYAAKAAKQPKTDFKFPFNKKEIEAAFTFAADTATVNPYGFDLGKYNGYQPEKYGVMDSMNRNGEARAVYGIDAKSENIGEESENSCSSSSLDESGDNMEDFIVVDEPTDAPRGASASPEQLSPVRTPSPPITPFRDGGGMKRVYATDTPIPLALRTWEVVGGDVEEDEEAEEEDDDDDDMDEDEMEE